MYVIIVHGFRISTLTDDGTDSRSRALSDISGLLIRKPITADRVISMNTAMLI
jgi:hypothetical protein